MQINKVSGCTKNTSLTGEQVRLVHLSLFTCPPGIWASLTCPNL